MTGPPPLSVVLPTRGGLEEVAPVLEALASEAERTGTEVVVVGDLEGGEQPGSDSVRLVPVAATDMLELHKRGMAAARGEVVAIGEDHAMPTPGWCAAVIRSHRENDEADAVVGCLINATDTTLAGRANFLAFAAPWQPPMPELPAGRPPPASTLSFKRRALREIGSQPAGWLEAELIPSLFARGAMVADERIVVDHHQDHGSFWSVRNAFHSARSSYGSTCDRLAPDRRRRVARWALANLPGRLRSEAREASGEKPSSFAERTLITLIACAAGLGAAVGTLAGPGRSGERVA